MIVCIAARGQTLSNVNNIDLSGLPQATQAKQLCFWFDDDVDAKQIVNPVSGHYELDVSDLFEGMHTLHYQVINTKDEVTYIASRIFLKVGFENAEENSVGSLNYWFDDNIDVMQTDKTSSVILDVSTLKNGLHTLHYQVQGRDGNVYYIASDYFIKIDDAEIIKVKKLMYWFDNDVSIQHTDISNGTKTLDTSILTEGLHTLHYQIADSNGNLCPPLSSIFLKTDWSQSSTTAKRIRYWYDEEASVEETSVLQGTQTLETERLVEGLHTLHYQIVDSNGSVGTPVSSLFLKINASVESEAKDLRYWFDDDVSTITTMNASNGTQTLDVSELPTGLHTINYQLIDRQGNATVPIACYFMKASSKVVAEGENRIIKYQYWLNQNSQAMQTVELDAATNPYTLITLLPIQKEPILSSCFQFEVTNGQPTIYARNTLHVRFHDSQGYFTDACKQYVDERVSDGVIPIGELKSSQNFDRISDNDIRWYTISLEEGDSVAFRTTQACSIQLFSPLGKELYNASSSNSVEYGGCHAWEDGVYYLAIHDVTGSQSTMRLDYMHMDKYDVVGQDVAIVGNGGCSTITFTGNGFKDLYAVDLFNANGDTIHHVFIGHESDASTSVVFDFTGATLGTYNAKFYFSEEDKTFADLMTVEEAVDIELATTVTYPSTFLRGTSTTYTIKITNKGNMTAYQVPIDIQLFAGVTNDINDIKFSDNIPALQIDWTKFDSIAAEEKDALKNYMKNKGDMLHFITTYDSINNQYVKVCLLAYNLPPSSTFTFTLSITSNEEVTAQFRIPTDWNSYTITEASTLATKRRNAKAKDTMCCYREKVECVMNVIVSAADFASFFAGPQGKLATCITDLGNTMLQFSYDVWCGDNHGGKDMRKAAEDLIWDAVNGLIGCATNIPGLSKISSLDWVYQHIYNNIATTMDCVSAISTRIPNCPPTPPHGGTSTPVNSLDPNEIYGYTSESDSKFITDSIQALNYTIEFENDTAFATSSAHVVVVTDTLDGRYFDLKSFKPTAIKIGDKTVELDGTQNFVKTIDVRPAINAIAQIEGRYDAKKGIATWTFTSLDPMTMEPTDDVMQGFLPINYDGTSGMGQVMFDINLKQKFDNGTEIPNRAGIVFDSNDVIMTPTWVNTIDAIAPTSRVTDCEVKSSTTATLHLKGNDNMSGVWKYDVYVQYGEDASWFKCQENVTDTLCDVRIYSGMNHGFMVIATDSAGNREIKELHSECRLITIEKGDINSDGEVTAQDASLVQQYVAGKITLVDESIADVNNDGKVDAQDASLIQQYVAGKISW